MILHSSFFILHSSLMILHSSLMILHSSLMILHSSLMILHSSFFILHLPSGSSNNQASAHDALLHMVLGQATLNMADENVGCLLAHTDAPLLDGGEHGVAGNGSLAIRKAADADILGHSQSHALYGIENANGGIVVHSEEGIGILVAVEHIGCDELRVLTVVTMARHSVVEGQAVIQQRILIAIETVLADFQVHLRTVVGNVATTCLDEMCHSVVGTHIVIDDDATGIHTRADAVVENQRHTSIYQPLEVLIVLRVLGLGNDDATNLVLVE